MWKSDYELWMCCNGCDQCNDGTVGDQCSAANRSDTANLTLESNAIVFGISPDASRAPTTQ